MKAGTNIIWKGGGIWFKILSGALCLFDTEWAVRDWKGWHMGFVVKTYASGEIITSQAIVGGIHTVTYSSIEDMGDCRFYNWLDDTLNAQEYADDHEGDPYDGMAYVWTILAYFVEKIFHWKFRVVNRAYTCWEHMSQMDRYCGKPLQPMEEFPMVNKIMKVLEFSDI